LFCCVCSIINSNTIALLSHHYKTILQASDSTKGDISSQVITGSSSESKRSTGKEISASNDYYAVAMDTMASIKNVIDTMKETDSEDTLFEDAVGTQEHLQPEAMDENTSTESKATDDAFNDLLHMFAKEGNTQTMTEEDTMKNAPEDAIEKEVPNNTKQTEGTQRSHSGKGKIARSNKGNPSSADTGRGARSNRNTKKLSTTTLTEQATSTADQSARDHKSTEKMWDTEMATITKTLGYPNTRSHSGRGYGYSRQGSQGRGYTIGPTTTLLQTSNQNGSDMEESSDEEEDYDLAAIVKGYTNNQSTKSDSSQSTIDDDDTTTPKDTQKDVTSNQNPEHNKTLLDNKNTTKDYRKAANLYNKTRKQTTPSPTKPIATANTTLANTSPPKEAPLEPASEAHNVASPIFTAEDKDDEEMKEDYDSDATTKTGWKTVQSGKTIHTTSKTYTFGIHASRVSQHDEEGFHPDDIKMILRMIYDLDKDVLFLPHNNNHKLACSWKQLQSNYNYKSMMNFTSKRWGRPTTSQNSLFMLRPIPFHRSKTSPRISKFATSSPPRRFA
jgi:hypothetical protein